MEKYVYDFIKTLTRDELIEELKGINCLFPKKEEILNRYDVDMTDINIDDIEATIRVNSFKKDIALILKFLNFSILNVDKNEKYCEDDRVRLLDLLRWNGIDLELCNIDELGKVAEALRQDENVINYLNKKYIDKNVLKEALSMISSDYLKDLDISNVSERTINDLLILIDNTTNQQNTYLPTVRNKYYDENNNQISKVEVVIPEENSTNLKQFNGEIYEKLDFETDEEAKKYALEHEINDYLDSEVKTYIHFKGKEDNDNWHKEMTIIKQRNAIVINYGDNYILTNNSRNTSIDGEEIQEIIEFLTNKTPNNEFLKYVIRELKRLKKAILCRGYTVKEEPIDKENLKRLSDILCNEQYGEDRNIFFKSKIISSEPLKFVKKKVKTLK